MRRMSPFPVRRPLAPAALAAAVLVVALAGCAPAPTPPPAPAAPSLPRRAGCRRSPPAP